MIPNFQTLMRPVLQHLSDGAVHASRDVRDAMADAFQLTPAERLQMLPSGRQRTMDNRVGWALTYLYQAGLVTRPRRGQVQINEAGQAALTANPERIDMKVLDDYPSYVEFKERRRDTTGVGRPTDPAETLPEAEASTPSDLLEHAVLTNRAAVEGDVLQAALALSPTAFEELVIHLLRAMGYGRSSTGMGSLERTSATGDAGIDGIISQDPLGLDRIYVQAKRYAVDRPIDRPRIHEFAGALLGKQGDRGVYITTSRFTEGARTEADRINARIELIDGARLAQLLVEHGVGVQPEQVVTLYRLDEDFFETL
ncbi:restriction endonuclease [Propionibacteriaceae bacterium Y1923]